MRLFALFAVAILCSVPGPSLAAGGIIGAEPFTAIAASGGLSVMVYPGEEHSIFAHSNSPRALTGLRTAVRGEVLYIWIDRGMRRFTGLEGVSVEIGVPQLTAVSASSRALVDIEDFYGDELDLRSSRGAEVDASLAEAKTYRLRAIEGGSIHIDGACGEADLRASAGGQIAAKDLLCSRVTARLGEGGRSETTARQRVSGVIATGAHLTVWGHPESRRVVAIDGGTVEFGGEM